MSEEQTITIEVDGKELQATPGQMLIEVTDEAGITVPRFCYHKHLSVSANCRMCLVEVEKAPKPLPACATPVMDGMKVYTRSPLAREAQKGTMEFLLINHPLDCPICDQGGECELQDVAVGYGGDVSQFSEQKRIVKDHDIGPLISTDMTRCIHCTRCVRFGGEVAGLREMGATGRGEHMHIGLYVENSVVSELSGNVIDLCPVGALTSKPFRFTARAWELTQRDTVACHDGVGSNLHLHMRRDQVMRAVPKENDALNQTWISDRDRFSYEGMYSADRLTTPMIREGGSLKETDWQSALQAAAKSLKDAGGDRLGVMVSPSATLEEQYLAAKLTRGLGSNNIDHRMRQGDFRADASDPALPWLGQNVADLESNQATLLVGSWLRKDQPMLNHRVRNSVINGGVAMAINPIDYDYNYDLDVDVVCKPSEMVAELAGVAAALGASTAGIKASADEAHKAIADYLKEAEQGTVLMGTAATMHPDFAILRQLANNIAKAADLNLGFTGLGANDTGAWMAGAVPHRVAGGAAADQAGMNVEQMLASYRDVYMTVGFEPHMDSANPAAMSAGLQGGKVICLSSYNSPWLQQYADIVLPIAEFAETSGTYVNLQGDAQSFAGAVSPAGESRPAWKVLRVLGNLVDLDGFDFVDSAEVHDEVLGQCSEMNPDNTLSSDIALDAAMDAAALERVGGVPMHSVDAMCRRANALQHTPDSWSKGARVNANAGFADGDSAQLTQDAVTINLTITIDDSVPDGCVWLPTTVEGSEQLGSGFGAVSLEKA